jgi:hypothetical protein
MTRHVLRLIALTAFALLSQTPAFASDASSNAGIKLAMGPMSATLKNQNQGRQAAPDDTTGTTPKLHHHAKHKPKPAQ